MLSSGDRLDEFEIRGPLGEGGMGQVYLARDTALKREVALKVISDSLGRDPAALARFQREAELLAAVQHPNIAAIHRVAAAMLDGQTIRYLVLERVEGETLAERLRRGPVPVDEAMGIASQIARALQAAHRQGVIHRDLKPANVMLAERGRVKVLDFGIAKALMPAAGHGGGDEAPTRADVTATGTIVGTPQYMSPEQVRGSETDARTDIWALGCLLYEMLVGRPPFAGETAADVMSGILEHEPDLSALPGPTPESVHSLLRRCLQKNHERRLRDIGDARLELEDALQPTSGPQEPVGRNQSHARMRRAVAAAAGSVAILSIMLVANPGGVRDWLGDDAPASSASSVASTVVLPATVEGPEDDFTVGLHRLITDYLVDSGELSVKLPPTQLQIDQLGGEYTRLARVYDGVDAFVVPTVATAPGITRLDLSLVDPRTRVVLWSGRVSGTTDHYQDMARRVFEQLMAALRPEFEPAPQRASTNTTSAAAAIQLRAGQDFSKRYNHRRDRPFYDNARQRFDAALELDPTLAAAAAERGLLELFLYESTDDPSVLENVGTWSERARRLDPRNSLGWMLRSAVLLKEGDLVGGLAPALRSAALDPRSSIAHLAVGMLLGSAAVQLGYPAVQRAIDLDPAYLYPLLAAAEFLLIVDRSVESLRLCDRALASEPDFILAKAARVQALIALGRLDEAAEEMALIEPMAADGRLSAETLRIGFAMFPLARALQRDEARVAAAYAVVLTLLSDSEPHHADDELLAMSASALAVSGRRDQALTLLELSPVARQLPYDFWWLLSDLEPLRSDPRFARAAAPAGEHFAALRQVIEESRAAGEFPDYLEEPYRDLLEQLEVANRPVAGGEIVAASSTGAARPVGS